MPQLTKRPTRRLAQLLDSIGALGEIRTPYPLVRRQVREIQFILCSSTGYKAYPVSRFEQHPVCNPLKCQVSLLSSETAFQVAYAEVEP